MDTWENTNIKSTPKIKSEMTRFASVGMFVEFGNSFDTLMS